MLTKTVIITSCLFLFMSCAVSSQWKIQGGPQSCVEMCKNWNLEFTAMVGVGDQGKYGDGATACVCQPGSHLQTSSIDAASGSSATSFIGPVVAAQAAQAASMAAASNAAVASQAAMHH